jgi:hypothetical protein
VGGACSTHGERKKHTKYLSKNLKGRDHSKVIGVKGKIILE